MSTIKIKNEIGKDTTLFGLIMLITLIITGSLFFHIIEGHTLFDSFYFVMMTLTTVGYGDIVPTSIVGKLITILYALMGIPLFVFIAGYIVQHRISSLVKEHIKHQSKHIGKIKTELSEIEDDVEDINEDIEDISEDIENISEKIHEIDTELQTKK